MSGTTRESDKARAAQGSEQGRAITRGEEGPILAHDDRVRPVIAKALGVEEGRVYLTFANEPPYQLERIGIDAFNNAMIGGQREKAARAGIVPGADGWWWAAAAAPVESPPPSWLTAAVLAALPCDGQPVDLVGVYAHVAEHPDYRMRSFAHVDAQCAAVLAALVQSGEIEACPGGWRRWGVPEGWGAWDEPVNGITLLRAHGAADDRANARAEKDGSWWAYPSNGEQAFARDVAQPPTLAAARTAALRACHERGVFAAGPLLRPVSAYLDATQPGPDEPVPEHPRGPGADGLVMGAGVEGAPVRIMRDALIAGLAAPAPTRAEQVRHALLAVLARGPVAGLSYVLEALSAEGVQPAPDGREAKQAAREIGATRDGARWSLSEGPPPGWGWVEVNGAHYLAPIGSGEPVADSIANVAWADSLWTVTEMGCDGRAIERGEAGDDEGAQAAALAAARRAGLFARPPAVEVTGDGGPAVLPAVTSQGGEAVVPVAPASPLDALALAICVYPNARVPEVRDALRAWGAALVEQARAPLADTIRALTNRQTVDASGTWRVHGEDGVTVVSEDVLVPHPTDPANARARASATPHATVQASLAARAYAADAPLLYAVWKAATTARDAYRAEGMSSRFSRSLVALWDLLDAADRELRGVAQPCPACATAERRVAAVEGTCRELDDERAGLQRSLDAAIAAATRAEAKLATLGAEIDALHARWAGAK